ncbi:DUF445 domain-containing protein [Dongia deserti]|uniref:DUF445 domain-containing protein n=1 Tax=Dongia deserti TaxID=2268030 RepID=UPI0013C4179D|nr:DUF445 domain-containing protein [Dongia deserti]
MADISATAAAIDQRRSLRRHRTYATALLVVMGIGYVAALRSGFTGYWMELFQAGTEAALVGGLADWFAVTALFRRPLGLPIPHTAVIPNSKERIGLGLGSFIERHFLEPELVAARLRAAGISRRLGAWLADRRNADLVSDRLVVISSFVFRSLNDQKLQRLMQMMLRRQIREVELAPALATLLAVLRQNGTHQQLFDYALGAVRHYISMNEDRILEIVEERSRWWVPRRVDRRVAKEIADGLIAYIDDLQNRSHEARASFDAAIERFIADLRQEPAYRAKINDVRDRILAAPQVNAYFATLWQGLRGKVEDELAQPNSRFSQALSGVLRSIGTAIADDPEVQARMDRRVEEVVMTLIVPWRKEIGHFVADVVRSWETSTIVDRVELAVGKDLQYIRVNGTLVGAAVGCAIFAISELLR